MNRVSHLPDNYHLTKRVTVRQIQNVVADAFGIAPEEMTSPSRKKRVAHPRQVAMYITRRYTPYSLPRIGQFFGNRDHSTVIHAVRAVDARLGQSTRLRSKVVSICSTLGDNCPPPPSCGESGSA